MCRVARTAALFLQNGTTRRKDHQRRNNTTPSTSTAGKWIFRDQLDDQASDVKRARDMRRVIDKRRSVRSLAVSAGARVDRMTDFIQHGSERVASRCKLHNRTLFSTGEDMPQRDYR